MELNRDINLVTGGPTVLGVIDLLALAVVAVGCRAEHTSAVLVAAVGAGLAVGLGREAGAARRQSAFHLVGAAGAVQSCGGGLGSKHLGALASGGGDQEDGGGVGLVDLLKLWDEGLSIGWWSIKMWRGQFDVFRGRR